MKVPMLLAVLLLFLTSQLPAQTSATRSLGISSPRVLTVGDFPHAGPIKYTKGMTLTKAVIAAGGIHDYADGKLYLVRCGKSRRIDLRVIFKDPTTDPVLQPWDILYLNP